MRITSWNVNGIVTLRQYKPWVDLPDLEACLEYLEADIACFQETKITRKAVTAHKHICILSSFHSFFDFHPNRGYSGTVTYVRKSVCSPIKSEIGLTGSLLPLQIRSNPQHSIGCYPEKNEEEMDTVMFKSLDAEGRSVVTDCGMFVLFNLYCPNLTNEERSEFKMSFYLCLEERIRNLLAAGREVIVVGDLNIIRHAIDHPEPAEQIRAFQTAGLSSFTETTQSRKWLNSMIHPNGPLHDVGREMHPNRAKFYTCWETLRNTRPQNYGSRLDYTFTSSGIRDWVKSADIQPELMGSDHCPVFIDLFDEREIDGKVVKLKDLLSGGGGIEKGKASPPLPPLVTSNWPDFKGNQTIKDLFAKAKINNTQKPIMEENSSTIAAIAAESENEKAVLLSQNPSSLSMNSLVKNSENSEKSISNPFTSSQLSSSSSSQGKPVESQINYASSSSSSALKRSASSASTSYSSKKEEKSKKKKKVGQQKLKNYFKKEKVENPEIEEEEEEQKEEAIIPESKVKLGKRKESSESKLESEENSETNLNSNHSDNFPSTLPSNQSDFVKSLLSESKSPSKEEQKKVSDQWSNLFQKPEPPKCPGHGEDAVYRVTNKPGPNRGRAFWACNRPVGEGYEKTGRKNPNAEYQCNYFLWESDRPKNNSTKSSKPTSRSSSGSVSPKKK